jgi:hypothetical protein
MHTVAYLSQLALLGMLPHDLQAKSQGQTLASLTAVHLRCSAEGAGWHCVKAKILDLQKELTLRVIAPYGKSTKEEVGLRRDMKRATWLMKCWLCISARSTRGG